MELTGLNEESTNTFLYQNPMPHDYARQATNLEIKMWIKFSFKNWHKIDTLPTERLE